jgi:HD-GYP domain-containing protein (c-di-GMP phosphodiesterase class II)
VRQIRLAEVLGGLSFALDLTEGQPGGHILRTTLIGMALGERAGLAEPELADLYHALLLKDIGCTANASRTSALLAADDREVKPALKLTDLSTRKGRANWALRVVARHERPLTRARTVRALARGEGLHEALIRLRCERGRELALDLGFPAAVADAIGALDEHWNGEGHPDGIAGEAIPRLSRILLLAQTAEVFAAAHGTREALAVVRGRSGRWFDPDLAPLVDAEVLGAVPRDEASLLAAVVEAAPPGASTDASEAHLTQVAHAFAEVVDAKSPWTARHSHRVAALVTGMAERTGHAGERDLVRAALLKDIGTVGISSRILDKPGALTPREWEEVRRHTTAGGELLARVVPYRAIAAAAADHHERLDGSGYPRGLSADQIDLDTRILTVCDIYDALISKRVYRGAWSHDEAMQLLRRETEYALDERCVAALEQVIAREQGFADTAELATATA